MSAADTILNKIENYEISDRKIPASKIPESQILILLVAFYQYHNFPKSQIVEFLSISKNKYKDYPHILGLIKTLLNHIKSHKYHKAFYQALLNIEELELQEESTTLTNEELDSLLKQEQYTHIIQLCGANQYFNDIEIQKRHIESLIKLNRLDDALRLCFRPKLISNPDIQSLLSQIQTLKDIQTERQAIEEYYNNLLDNEIPHL